ncbi:MAG: RagB/SusD family nutrient uptake outer membrane protein [Tannerella sp.]|nr:RagB/SusD family nutrient uptake outer membrane protein [Tannerella sp.]
MIFFRKLTDRHSLLVSVLPFCWFVPIVFLASCNYLNIDEYFSDEFKEDSIFSNKRYVEAYMWGAATLFPDEGQIFSASGQAAPGPLATDEAFTMFNIGSGSYNGMRLVQGFITPDNPDPFFNQTWIISYKVIRKCNNILKNIDKTSDLTASDRLSIISTTRFLRAYAYYRILIDYGPPVLLGDEIVENNATLEYYDCSRSTYDEAVEYICKEFEEAAQYMPATLPLLNFGRPTRGVAYALVARLRLIHASPLFNGGQSARTCFGSWIRKTDGKHYITQEYSEKRWAVAAAAAKRVMDMENAGVSLYRLYTVDRDDNTPALPATVPSADFPDGAGNIDPYRSYSEIFNGESVASINPEFIWAYKSAGLLNYTQGSFPVDHGGWGGMAVTQKVVDTYYMADGRAIDNPSSDYPYSESGFSSSVKTFSGYQLNAGVSNMYVNREMRFYASIGFSECYWPALSSTTAGDSKYTVTYYYDSSSGRSNPNAIVNFTPTGYVIKKYIHPMDSWQGTNARKMDKIFPIIRYAEILLSYAEALNNLTQSHTIEIDGQSRTFSRNMQEIMQAFNQVRYRAGLPGLIGDESANDVQALVEKERMIEFLFENRRYYDVRRWGKYEESESEPVMGMNVDAGKDGFYQRVIPNTSRIGSRVVNRKMIFLPISRSEIRRLPSFDQNPGWE